MQLSQIQWHLLLRFIRRYKTSAKCPFQFISETVLSFGPVFCVSSDFFSKISKKFQHKVFSNLLMKRLLYYVRHKDNFCCCQWNILHKTEHSALNWCEEILIFLGSRQDFAKIWSIFGWSGDATSTFSFFRYCTFYDYYLPWWCSADSEVCHFNFWRIFSYLGLLQWSDLVIFKEDIKSCFNHLRWSTRSSKLLATMVDPEVVFVMLTGGFSHTSTTQCNGMSLDRPSFAALRTVVPKWTFPLLLLRISAHLRAR